MTYRKQLRTVMLIEIAIIAVLFGFAYLFWHTLCPELDFKACVGNGYGAPGVFLAYAILRPLTAAPVLVISLMAGDAFGPWIGAIMAAFGATLSSLVLFLPAKYLGKIYVKGFLATNLPAMWKLMRTQDYKIVFFTRWLPIFPFDILSVVFGVLDFRIKSLLWATFLGVLPECIIFAALGEAATNDIISTTLTSISFMAAITLIPLLIYEYLGRKQGSSLWVRIKNTYRELILEIKSNNEVKNRSKKNEGSLKGQIPVILVYGFFSSRKSLTVMERLLESQGHTVLSFNLGGMFGVFFTSGIKETAAFIDRKINRLREIHQFEEISIVAHSKGGLVALWWLLNLGGSKYCKTLITMGTPFRGTYLTFLALVTPLGFFWRDVWQMRPGSEFLTDLKALPVPDHLRIYCLYSQKDAVSRGRSAIYCPKEPTNSVIPIPMNQMGHFEFLYKRDVGDILNYILSKNQSENVTFLPTAKEKEDINSVDTLSKKAKITLVSQK